MASDESAWITLMEYFPFLTENYRTAFFYLIDEIVEVKKSSEANQQWRPRDPQKFTQALETYIRWHPKPNENFILDFPWPKPGYIPKEKIFDSTLEEKKAIKAFIKRYEQLAKSDLNTNKMIEFAREMLRSENIKEDNNSQIKEIMGVSNFIVELIEKIKEAAQHDRTVLITGDTGTGKELVAKNIHYQSDRKNAPFVTLNVSAITKTLFESQMFGIIKGMATNVTGYEGKIMEANTGTVFFDEIGDMPLDQQAKILRFLEEKEISPIGKKTEKVNVRVLAATNKDLNSEIKKGSFREDLYYRLNQYHIKTIALDERPEDIIVLTKHFIFRKYKDKYGRNKEREIQKLKLLLYSMEFPGNVRELESYCSEGLEYTVNLIKENLSSGKGYIPKPKRPILKKNEDTYHYGTRIDKYNKDIKKYRKLKALRNFLYMIDESNEDEYIIHNGEKFDIEKCIRNYEFKNLFHNTNISKDKIARAMHVSTDTFSPKEFKEYFGYNYPKERKPKKYFLYKIVEKMYPDWVYIDFRISNAI